MPAISGGDNVIIQGRPIGRRWTLYVYQPATLWTGTVGGSPSRGDRSLTVATVTGALADIYSDMTIRVTDSADAIKDYPSKVRFRDDPDATTITIGDNNIDWTAGDKLTAQRLFEIWPRHVYIDSDGVQFKDRDIAWSSDAEVQRPKANGGPAAIGTLSGGVCDLVFTDAGSFVTPTGGAITSQAWAAMGGTPAVQAGAENSGTVTYRYSSAGYYYVRHTVQDANAKTGFVYIPVIVDDGTYGITGAVPGDREWDKSVKGWKLSRDLLGLDTDETKFYDGAPVFLAADDNQVADSAFPANRSHLRWSGWLIEDDVSRAKRSRTISYRAVSTNHILQTIPAYPIRIGVLASPADWYNIKTANTDAISLYLMFWHSTVHHICDYHPTGEYASRLRAGERCRSENLLSQLNWVLAGPVADLRCDRQGVLRAIRSEWHLSAAEQAAITTVFSMALEDVQSIEYGPRPHRATVREVKAGGVDGSSNPYLSGAPGAAPLDGGRPEEFMSLAPNSQAELNQWCAQELSVRNWSIPVTIKLAGEYDVVDPALGEFVWFNAGTLFGEPKLPNGDFSIDGVRFTDDHQNGYTFAEWELIPDPSA